MWPVDQIRGLARRLTRPRIPDLVIDVVGFSLHHPGQLIWLCSWEDVVRIIAFKRDHGMYDEICLHIDVDGRIEPLCVSEDFGGYKLFVSEWASCLPGVVEDWWSRVAFPAFEENATIIYSRIGAA
jgi:hypothetical protein